MVALRICWVDLCRHCVISSIFSRSIRSIRHSQPARSSRRERSRVHFRYQPARHGRPDSRLSRLTASVSASLELWLEHPDVGTIVNSLAGLYKAQGQHAKAEPLYKRALEIREKALGLEHPNVEGEILRRYCSRKRPA